jgi:hypothetical protein
LLRLFIGSSQNNTEITAPAAVIPQKYELYILYLYANKRNNEGRHKVVKTNGLQHSPEVNEGESSSLCFSSLFTNKNIVCQYI